jgi:ribulose-5-phosphate 4-epimerase/fuculose-1-phosphate aldolase
MAHHGLITVGTDLKQAYGATQAAETTARVIIMARSMGAKLVTLDLQEAQALREMFLKYYHPKRN